MCFGLVEESLEHLFHGGGQAKSQGLPAGEIPVWLQMVFSGIVLLGSFTLPEVLTQLL